MKRSIFLLSILGIISAFALQSCNQSNEMGTIRFGFELTDDSGLKSVSPDMILTEALVSIVDNNGQLVYDKEPLPLYNFGGNLITKSLQLGVGRYALVEFMLVDSTGTIIWATPKEGSVLAHLVQDPLPANFRVSANQTTNLGVEVIKVGDHPPVDFGYVSFDIEFINRFCLQVFYSSCCYDNWNDSILTAEGSFAPVYQSRLMVWTKDRKVLDAPMRPGHNRYALPISQEPYHFAAINCHGEKFYHQEFRLGELLRHRCGPDFEPLIIYDVDSSVYITPEGLKDPTINQGVFGQITVPVNDSTITEEYQVRPVVREIYFFPYFELDSIFYNSDPNSCLFNGEIPADPALIVRSNTDGYFQAALDTGEYIYMVKVDGGYFIDLYVSSHLPGKVVVYPDEVTKLYIHMVDSNMVY